MCLATAVLYVLILLLCCVLWSIEDMYMHMWVWRIELILPVGTVSCQRGQDDGQWWCTGDPFLRPTFPLPVPNLNTFSQQSFQLGVLDFNLHCPGTLVFGPGFPIRLWAPCLIAREFCQDIVKAVGDRIAQAVTKQPLKAGMDSQGLLTQSSQIADKNLRPGEEKWHV